MRIVAAVAALVVTLSAPLLAQQSAAATSGAEAVVQRFVDAANARDAGAMAALVAPDAVFLRFPSGTVLVQGRDSIQAMYARSLPPRPPEFRITIGSRIVEGDVVIDQELIAGGAPGRGRVTWMYLVRGGLIAKAWVVENPVPVSR